MGYMCKIILPVYCPLIAEGSEIVPAMLSSQRLAMNVAKLSAAELFP